MVRGGLGGRLLRIDERFFDLGVFVNTSIANESDAAGLLIKPDSPAVFHRRIDRPGHVKPPAA